MSSTQPVSVAITMGDPAGIGPEVIAKALADEQVRATLRPLLYGDDEVFASACALAGVDDWLPRRKLGEATPPEGALVVCSRLGEEERRPATPSPAGGRAQRDYLEAAIASLRDGSVRALCTGPIRKVAIQEAGLDFPGHTELLAERFGVPKVVMMLAGPVLRVALATTHLPLAEVASRLDVAGLVESLRIVDRSLREQFRIAEPRIAVCGLNPHAGEEGLFGDEEGRVIRPAIERVRVEGIDAEGPYPADGLFPTAAKGGWDAVVAMYHDQGLIPVKTVHRESAVNITLGLPIVRTSPDHGVAYDIAGKGVADPRSTREALLLAARLAGAGR